MQIILDLAKKDLVLLKKDSTEISRYPYKSALNDDYTEDDVQKEIDDFNKTLAMQDEFDNIKELSKAVKIHNW